MPMMRVRRADSTVIGAVATDDPVRALPKAQRLNANGELQDLLISWGRTDLLERWVGHAALDVVDQAPELEAWQQAGDPADGTLQADLQAGVVTRTAAAVDRPLATVIAERTAALNAERAARLRAGCLYPFPDAAGNGTITFKDPWEAIRYQELRADAAAMIAADQGATTFPAAYRDEENQNHTLTAQQLYDALTAARTWYLATWVKGSQWKDLVAAAETPQAAATVAPDPGWPSADLT